MGHAFFASYEKVSKLREAIENEKCTVDIFLLVLFFSSLLPHFVVHNVDHAKETEGQVDNGVVDGTNP